MPASKSRLLLLPSAARTQSTASASLLARRTLSIRLYLNLTAAPGGAGLVVIIRGYDATGAAVELTTGGDPVTQTGCYAYEMSSLNTPDDAFGMVRDSSGRSIPYQWDAQVKHLDGLSYTYSLTAETVSE
jgi:hypothetical protein